MMNAETIGWRKSSRCGANTGYPVLVLTPAAWTGLLDELGRRDG